MDVSESTSSTDQNDEKEGEVSSSCDNSLVQTGPAPNSLDSFILEEDIEIFSQSPDTSVTVEQNVSQTLEVSSLTQNVNTVTPNDLAPHNIDTVSISTSNFCNERAFSSNVCPELEGIAHSLQLSSEIATLLVEAASTSRGIETCVSNPDSTTFECVTNVPDDLNTLSDEISTTNEDSNPVSTTSLVVTSECSTSKPSLLGDEPIFEIHTTPTNLKTVKESRPQNSGISTTSTLKTLQLKPEPQDNSPTHSRHTSLQSLNRQLSAHIHNESRPSTSQNSALITSHNLQPTISSVTSTKNLTNANIPTPPHDLRPIFVKKDDKFELIISKANESMSVENSRPIGEDMACSSTSHHYEVISDNSTVTSSLSKKSNLVTSDPQSSSDITTSNSEVSTSSSNKIKIKNKGILKTSASELISKSDTSPGAKVENQSSLSFSNTNQLEPSAIEDMNTSQTQKVFQRASIAPQHIKSESNSVPLLTSDKPCISADVGESSSLNKLTNKKKISVILVDAANSSQPGFKSDTDTNIFRTHQALTLKSGIGSKVSLLEIDSSTKNMPLIDVKKGPGDAGDVSLKYTTKSPPTVTKSRFKLIRPSYSMPSKSSLVSEPSSTSHIPEFDSDVKATKKEFNSKETSSLGISELNIPTYNRDMANSLEQPHLERPEKNVCSLNKTESFSKELTQEKQSTSTNNIVECGKKITVPNTSTQVVLCASKTSLPTENKEIKSQNLLTKDEIDPIVLVSNKVIDLESIPKKEDSKEYLKHENISLNTSPLPKTFSSQKEPEEKLSDTLVSKEQADAEHLSQPSKVKIDQPASKIMTSSSQPLLVTEKNKTESLKGKECLENKSDTKVITTSSKEKVILKSLSVSLLKLPHNIETIGIEKLKSVVDDSNKQMSTSTAKTFMKCFNTIPIKKIDKKPNEEITFLDTSRQEQNECKTHNPTLSHSMNNDSLPNTETVTGDKKALMEENSSTHSSPKVLVSPEKLTEVDPKYDSTSQTPARVCDTMETSKQIKESKEICNNDEAQKNNTRAIEENSASGNLKIDEHLTSDKKSETSKEIIINKHKEENVSVSSSSDIKSNLQFNKVKHEPLNKDTKDTIHVQKGDENIAKATEKLTTSIIKSTETDNIYTVTEGLESKHAVTEDTTARSTSKHKAYANQDGSKPISFSIVQSTGSDMVKSSSAIEREISKVEKLTLKLKKDVKTHSLPLLLSNQTQSEEHIATSDIKESTQLALLCKNETKVDKVTLKIKKDKAKSEIVTIPSLEDKRISTDIISPPNLKEVPAIEKITLKLRKDGSESFVATKITDTQISAHSSDKTKSDHEDPQSVKENQCSEKITLKLKKDSTKSDAFIVSSNDNSNQLEPSKISKAETPTLCLGKVKGPEKIMLKLKKDSSKSEIFAVTSPTDIIKPPVSIDVLKLGDTDIQIVDSPTVFEEPIVEKITLKRMKDSSKSDIFVATTSKDIDQVILDKNEITLLKPDKKTLKPRKDQENVGLVEKNVSSPLRDENKLEKLTLKLKKDHATSEITAEKKAKDSEHTVLSQTPSEHVSTLKPRKDQEDVGLVEKNTSSSLRDENKLEKLTLKLKKDHVTSEITAEKKAKDSEHNVLSQTPFEHVSTLKPRKDQEDVGLVEKNVSSPLRDENKLEKLTLKLKKDHTTSEITAEKKAKDSEHTVLSQTPFEHVSTLKPRKDQEDVGLVEKNTSSSLRDENKLEKLTLKLKKDHVTSEITVEKKAKDSEHTVLSQTPSEHVSTLKPRKDQEDVGLVEKNVSSPLRDENKLEKLTLKLKKDHVTSEITAEKKAKDSEYNVLSQTPFEHVSILKPRKDQEDVGLVEKNVSSPLRDENKLEKLTLKLKKDHVTSEITAEKKAKVSEHTVLSQTPFEHVSTLKPRKDQEDVSLVEKNVSSPLRDENNLEKLTLKLKKDHVTSEITAEKNAKDSEHTVLSQTPFEHVSTLKPRKDQEDVGLVDKNVSSPLRDENKLEKLTLKLTKDHATSEITAEKKAKDSENTVLSQTPSKHVSTLKPRKDQEDVGLVEKNVSSPLRDENKLEKLTLKLKKDHVTSEITAEKKTKDSEHTISSLTPCEHVSTEIKKVETKAKEEKVEKLTIKFIKDSFSSEFIKELNVDSQKIDTISGMSHSSMEATKTDGQGQEGGKVEKLTLKLRKDTKVSEGSGGTKKVSEEFSVICDQDDSPSQEDKKNTSSFDQELLKEEKLEKITLKLNKDSSSLSISPKCHLKAVNADSEKTDKHSLKRKKELEVSCTSAEKKVKIGESSEDRINTEGIKDRICSIQQTSQPDIKPKEANLEKCFLKLKEGVSNKVDCETTTDRKQISNELTVKPESLDTMGNSKGKQAKEKHLDKIILKPDGSIDEKIVDNLNAKQLLHKERVETLQVVSADQDISTVQQIKEISEGSMTKLRDLSHTTCSQVNVTISKSKSELKSSSLVEIDSSGKCDDNLLKTKENTFGISDKSAITDSECKRENKDHIKSQVDPIKSSSMPDEIKIDLSKSTKKDYLSKQIKMGSNSEASASIVAVSDQDAKTQSSISKSSKKDDLSKQIKIGSNSESTTSIVAVSDQDSNIQSSISKSTKKDDLSKQIKIGSNSESTTSIVAVSDQESNIQSSISKSTKKDDLSKQIKTGTSFESTSSLVTDQDTKVQSSMSKTKEHKSDETPKYSKSNVVKISSDATEYAPNKMLTSKNISANETKPEKITLTLKKAAAWSVKQPEGKGGGKQPRAKDTEVSLLVHQSDILLKESSNKEIFEKPKNKDLVAGIAVTSKIGNTSPSAHIVANPSASSESLAVLTGSNQLDGNKITSTAFTLTVEHEIATKKRESDTIEAIPPCKILKIGDINAATLQGKSEVDRKITQSRCQAISRKRSSAEDNVDMGKSLEKLLKTDTKVHDNQVTSQLSRSKGDNTLKTSKTKHLPTLGKEAIEKYSKVEDKSMSTTLRKVNTLQTKPETQTNVETTSAHTTNIPKSSNKEIKSLFSSPTKCTKLENKLLTSTSSLEREMKEKLSLPSLATKHPNLEIKTVESSQTTLLPITDRKRSTSPMKQFSASTSKGNTTYSSTHADQTQKSSGALKVSAEDKLREILSRMGSRASSVLNSEISITLAPSKSTKPSGNFVETSNSGASDDIQFLDEVTSNEDDVSINLTPQISSVVKEGDDSSSQDIVILEEKITSPRSSSLTHQSGLFGLNPDLMDPLAFNERLVGSQINIATEFKQLFEGIKLPKKGRGRPRKLATDTNLKTKASLVGNTCANPTRPKRMCRGREERPLVAPKEKKPRAPGPGRGRGRKKKENEISSPGMPHILVKKPKLNLTSVATPGLIIPTTKIIKENISIETSAARPTTLEKTRPLTETPVAMTTSKMTTHTPVRAISESPYLTPGRVISESPYPTPGRVVSELPCPATARVISESLCPAPTQAISDSPCPTSIQIDPESLVPTPIQVISESPCPTPVRTISEAPCPTPVRAISESPCPTPVSSTVQVFEEETRMSAESNSRSQTPARSLPPAVSVEGPGEESQGSVISTATTESNKNKKNRMEIPLDTDKEFTVDMISEYQWPLDKTGEHLMIQEQISQYLGVKSFKRKYPDIRRRPVEAEEKTYLRDKGLVSEYMSDLGLTAVISSEILDIMYADFQEKYEEYRRFMRDRQAKEFTTKQKAISAVTSGEKSKQDYKEKALSSAANWNATFNRNRREQRRCCFDLQSFTIQYPSNRCLKMMPEETPKVGDYPIALIPGQFTDFYKAYTPTELRYFPLNTVLYGPMKPNERKDPAIVSDDSQSDSDDSSSSNSSSSSSSSEDSADSDDSESSSGEAEPESTQERVKEGETDKDKEKEKLRDATATCKVCSGDQNKNKESKPELLIHCGQCTSSSHPSCLDLTLDMVPHIKRYNWQCTDCKTCIQCKDPADEDKMLFCDMCDRGYHIYCVGLRRVPSGRWHCKECAVCGSCGTQQPAGNNDIPNAQWQHEYKKGDKGAKIYAQTLCVPCSKLWRKGRYCQLCWRCYGNKPDEEEGLINCSVCDKWMHAECCSAIGGNDLDRSSNFLCENCQEKGQARSSTIKTIPRTVVKV